MSPRLGAWGNQPCWHLDLSLAGPGPGCSIPADRRSPWAAPPSNQPVALGGGTFFSPHHHRTPVSPLVAVPTSQLQVQLWGGLLSPGGSPSPLRTLRTICWSPMCSMPSVPRHMSPVSAVSPRQRSCTRLELRPTGRCQIGNPGAGKGCRRRGAGSQEETGNVFSSRW